MKEYMHQLADAILQEWIDNDEIEVIGHIKNPESSYRDYNDAMKVAYNMILEDFNSTTNNTQRSLS